MFVGHCSLNTILSYLPKQRRTGLFSATQTKEVEDLIRAGLRNPVRISVKEKTGNTESSVQRTPQMLQNFYMVSTVRIAGSVRGLESLEKSLEFDWTKFKALKSLNFIKYS